ncbi:MAG: low molecular weight protein tyrosine phosphatase family protein [Geitlerinemataceae cyanobacterium]
MKKLLFICGKNRWRSPTAEALFSKYEGLEVESAGIDRDADFPLSSDAIQNADIVFVMEQSQRRKLSQKFGVWLKNKQVVCLDIPDRYRYMQPELIELLQQKVLPLLGTFS